MKEMTHAQARKAVLLATDHLLSDADRAALNRHLSTCEECRAYAHQLSALESDLQQTLHTHWDAAPLPPRPLLTELPAPESLAVRLGRMAINVVLVLLWLWLYRAVFPYLGVIFSNQEFRTNQIVLVGVLLILFSQVRRSQIHPRLDILPQLYLPALALALTGSACYLLVERFLDINTISAALFGLASYGLLGLWLSPRRWRDGLPAALLLIGALPFGEHMETFVGYPLRLYTADVVRRGLQALGITSVGTDTILVFESGISQVDSPCSGIKSLWTGALFFIAATWLERHPINLRWLGTAVLMGALLAVSNLARVAVLTLVGPVAHWEMLAEMVHIPLGVLGFVGVCVATLYLLGGRSRSTRRAESPVEGTLPAPGLAQPVWLSPVLAVVITGMALLYTPRPQSAAARATFDWEFPAGLQVQAIPFSPQLLAWVTEGGAESAERWHFEWQGSSGDVLSGSLMFLTSHTWRGQHRPERCFEVQGLTVDASQTYMIGDDFPVRYLTLANGPLFSSAVYWMQTQGRATDDFGTRIWADLAPQRQPWVLVTILFDEPTALDAEPEVGELLQAVRATLERSLEGDVP